MPFKEDLEDYRKRNSIFPPGFADKLDKIIKLEEQAQKAAEDQKREINIDQQAADGKTRGLL